MNNKRKVILLFLSAMTVSIIIMVIVYGVFIKDIDFSFNVKNPESAPSPIDMFDKGDSETAEGDSGDKSPAKVKTPDDTQKTASNTTDNTDKKSASSASNDDEPPLPAVVPLDPQQTKPDDQKAAEKSAEAPLPPPDDDPDIITNSGKESTPSMHFVYMDGFSTKAAADEASKQLQTRNVSPGYVRQYKGRVILQFGVYNNRENADEAAQQLRNQNVFVKVD